MQNVMQAEIMFETIREWPHYVNVPFPIAKVSPSLHHRRVHANLYVIHSDLFLDIIHSESSGPLCESTLLFSVGLVVTCLRFVYALARVLSYVISNCNII